MIIPIGHERGTVLRWPWVTLAIIAVCLGAYAYQSQVLANHQESELGHYREALQYYLDHLYLEPDRRLLSPEGGEGSNPQVRQLLQAASRAAPPADPERLVREQERLDELTAAWLEVRQENPYRRWGLRPASYQAEDLVTHLFVHSGILHLVGNLLLLYLAGPPIEDVWGRPLFGLFYFAAGAVAALAFAASYPQMDVPLVGASGAISGVMGAFLIRYWNVRIKFYYFFWFWVRILQGSFYAPAWVILPLWLGNEMFSAYVADQMAPQGGSGVAYWAHVWGFLFGAAVAFLVGLFNVEERFLRPRIHATIGMMENTALEEAYTARREGRLEEARGRLEGELAKEPGNREAALALWDLAREEGRAAVEAPRFLRVIREELRSGEVDLALLHWQEVLASAPDVRLDPGFRILLAEALARGRWPEEAQRLLAPLAAPAAKLPAGLLVRSARVAAGVDPALAATLSRAGLGRSDLPLELRPELEEILRQSPPAESTAPAGEIAAAAAAPGPPGPAAEPGTAPAPPAASTPRPAFGVLAGTPQEIRDERLFLHLDGQGRVALPLAKVTGLSAAEIHEAGYQPYRVLDLFIDPPRDDAGKLRLVRCLSSLFDPGRLVAADGDPRRAFRELVAELLRQGAGPRLALAGAGADPTELAIFPSLQEYEAALRRGLVAVGAAGSPAA